MAEPSSALDIITHPGTVAGGTGAAVMAFMRWLQGKEAQSVATQLALINQRLEQVTLALQKHEGLGERLALAEQTIKALHSRMDAYDAGAGRKRR